MLHDVLLGPINLKLVQILVLSGLAHSLLMELALEQVLLHHHLLVLVMMLCISRYPLTLVAWMLGRINGSFWFEDTDSRIIMLDV